MWVRGRAVLRFVLGLCLEFSALDGWVGCWWHAAELVDFASLLVWLVLHGGRGARWAWGMSAGAGGLSFFRQLGGRWTFIGGCTVTCAARLLPGWDLLLVFLSAGFRCRVVPFALSRLPDLARGIRGGLLGMGVAVLAQCARWARHLCIGVDDCVAFGHCGCLLRGGGVLDGGGHWSMLCLRRGRSGRCSSSFAFRRHYVVNWHLGRGLLRLHRGASGSLCFFLI